MNIKNMTFSDMEAAGMDADCIDLCIALNKIPGIQTTESCSGHGKNNFMIFFQAQEIKNLFIPWRVFDRRYSPVDTDLWRIEACVTDTLPAIEFFITTTRPLQHDELMKDVNKIAKEIEEYISLGWIDAEHTFKKA